MLIAKEVEQVCSILFDTKEKVHLCGEKNCFSAFDTIEIDDKVIKHEALIGPENIIFPFVR